MKVRKFGLTVRTGKTLLAILGHLTRALQLVKLNWLATTLTIKFLRGKMIRVSGAAMVATIC